MAPALDGGKKSKPVKGRTYEPTWAVALFFPRQGHWTEALSAHAFGVAAKR